MKKNILNVHWSVMRGKTIYTKPILSVLWSVMRRKKLKNNETNVCNVNRVKTNLYKNLY